MNKRPRKPCSRSCYLGEKTTPTKPPTGFGVDHLLYGRINATLKANGPLPIDQPGGRIGLFSITESGGGSVGTSVTETAAMRL
eukprot:CAMPEP_0114542152 /NCGR_PEP_ID=MMETSP0114-20121206/1688_1 /TAXON_ID=31324 /ORGANISM="Goniomonas sp, Strain m" /LENGTH=82 /DNA_ID=CAMNT_0001726441 /DNA_START=43 /DNA_END=291 /DNA_ORIENTATION=-